MFSQRLYFPLSLGWSWLIIVCLSVSVGAPEYGDAQPNLKESPPSILPKNGDAAQAPKSQESSAQPKEQAPSPIKRLNEQQLMVGEVLVDRSTRSLEIPARINMTKGILEYYGVTAGGKLHESVLEVMARPSHIHLALILAGYEPRVYGATDPKTYQRAIKKEGSILRLYIRWIPVGMSAPQWLPASAWIYDRSIERSPPPIPYVFQGSDFFEGKYVADQERSVIGLIEDNSTILSPFRSSGNPYRGDMLGHEIYTSAIPPKGTLVTLVVKEASPQEIEEVRDYSERLKRIQEMNRRRAIIKKRFSPVPPPPEFEVLIYLPQGSELAYEDRPSDPAPRSPVPIKSP